MHCGSPQCNLWLFLMALVITWIVVSHCKNRHFFYNVNIWYMHVFLFGPSILLSNSSVESIYSSSLFDADLLFSCSLMIMVHEITLFLWDYLWNIVLWSVLYEFQLIESPEGSTSESKLVHLLIVRSIHAAYKQVSWQSTYISFKRSIKY